MMAINKGYQGSRYLRFKFINGNVYTYRKFVQYLFKTCDWVSVKPKILIEFEDTSFKT